MKIVFFGSAKFIIPLIEVLHKNFDLALVVTTERDPSNNVPIYCKENNIPFLSIKNFSECMDKVKEEHAELGILASFGLLLPQEALDIFPKGIINIHPSLLPKYRGSMPVQSALLNGDHATGVSIIRLDEEMDHGPLLAQETANVLPADTTASLHYKLFKQGAEMLKKILPEYIENKLELKEQNHAQATFTKRSLNRQDGFIDAENPPSPNKLNNMIRAYYPWPGVWTKLIINSTEKIVKLLPEQKLQVEGKKPMSIKDFINGYPELKDVVRKLLEKS